MSTRCNIRLKWGDNTLYFYRHWDGYPAETGADLYQLIYNNPTPEALVEALIMATRGGDYEHDKDRKQYEITDRCHGDIEWFYGVNFGRNLTSEPPTVSVASGYGENIETLEPGMPLDDFRELCNRERTLTNARIDMLKRKDPHYANWDHYPMLDSA